MKVDAREMIENSDLFTRPGLFQSFYHRHPDGICLVDARGHVMDANPSTTQISGYTYEELTQLSLRELLGDPSSANVAYEREFAVPTKRVMRHKLGHAIHVRIAAISLSPHVNSHPVTFILLEDMTEEEEQRRRLLENQQRFLFISEESENIISSFSADGFFTYISPSVQALLGYAPEDIIGKQVVDFNHPDDYEELQKFHLAIAPHQDTGRFTGRVRHKTGVYRWYETTVRYIRDEAGNIVETIGVGRDITDRKQAEETVSYLAYHDALTDLPNRRMFLQHIGLVFKHAKQACYGVLFIDLDGFKDVNDTFGHDVGDLLLIEVGKRLTQTVGDRGMVARLGGDEFTILQTHVDNMNDWARFIEQIQHDVSKPVVIGDRTHTVYASVGAALYPMDGESVEALMRAADVAMYHAKYHGKK